ncbi:MAG: hypothetical protein GX958_10540 [Desulfitobacterium sp.]|nr:hypothetical protein [Desulfitobacterium sp.]
MFDYYKLIRNSTQLVDAQLLSISATRKEMIEGEISINLKLDRDVSIEDEIYGQIYLIAIVEGIHEGSKDEVFTLNIKYRGLCKKHNEVSSEKYKKYLYDQVVPLLLPYARECISESMRRMGLEPFYIPTMDVLSSVKANKEGVLSDDT